MSFARGSLALWSVGLRGFKVATGRPFHVSAATSAGKFLPSKVKLDKGREVKWCSCGKTKQQPFCDGSSNCGGKPINFKAQETKEYIFCNCKKSNRTPFCDGTHLSV